MTTQTANISTALTKEQVKAIKEATSVVFRHRPTGGVIELTKESKGFETRAEIPVTSIIVGKSGGKTHGTAVITTAQYAGVWRSVASLLKPGDMVRLEFQADYHRPHEKYEDIHLDTLIFKIDRKKVMLDFMIDVEVCRDGYAYRMIQ